MKGKKSFTAYCDWIDTFEALDDESAGKLVKHLFRYVNDQNPEPESPLIKAVFASMRATLKRDLARWLETIDERSKSGILGNLKRYHSDLHKKVIANKLTLEEAQEVAKSRKSSHSDTKLAVRDSVSVSVSVRDKEVKKGKPDIPSFEDFEKYALEQGDKLGYLVNKQQLKTKYFAWKEAGWRKGQKQEPIKNWKTTLLNTLQYISTSKEVQPEQTTKNPYYK